MPFFGLATEGDLKRASEEAQTMMGESLAKSIADINGRLNKAEECTQIINGVHLCSVPKYDKVVEPKDFKFGDFLHEKEKVCLHFDHIPDIIGTAAFERMSSTYGHGDIPDNYICYDGAKTSAVRGCDCSSIDAAAVERGDGRGHLRRAEGGDCHATPKRELVKETAASSVQAVSSIAVTGEVRVPQLEGLWGSQDPLHGVYHVHGNVRCRRGPLRN